MKQAISNHSAIYKIFKPTSSTSAFKKPFVFSFSRAYHAHLLKRNVPLRKVELNTYPTHRSFLPLRRQVSSSKDVLDSDNQTLLFMYNPLNGNSVYVVGTAHISKKSAEQVREVIQQVKPDTVLIELDKDRAEKIINTSSENLEVVLRTDLSKALTLSSRSGHHLPFGAELLQFALKHFYKFFQQFGIIPGLEFKVAAEEAKKIGATVVYGDTHSSTTFNNMWNSLSMQDFMRFMTLKPEDMSSFGHDFSISDLSSAEGIERIVEKMKDRKKARKVTELMTRVVPGIAKALIHDRDAHMANEIKKCKGTVVAVVGLAHLDGIEKNFKANEITRT